MERQMFCFQCEQTSGCTGCTGKAGVCGKTAPTAALQDELTGALIGLARAASDEALPTERTDRLLIQGLFTTRQCSSRRRWSSPYSQRFCC